MYLFATSSPGFPESVQYPFGQVIIIWEVAQFENDGHLPVCPGGFTFRIGLYQLLDESVIGPESGVSLLYSLVGYKLV